MGPPLMATVAAISERVALLAPAVAAAAAAAAAATAAAALSAIVKRTLAMSTQPAPRPTYVVAPKR